jgi:hypothetical protein
MVSTTDDGEFAPRSAARAEHAPAGPRLGPGLGLGLDDAPEPLPPLLPPIPLPSDGDGPLPRRGHPGDLGFTVAGPHDGASVWQQAQSAWQAAGAEWSTESDAARPTPPDADGSTPPDADGSTPPDADGPTPPDADGSTSPDADRTTSSHANTSLAALDATASLASPDATASPAPPASTGPPAPPDTAPSGPRRGQRRLLLTAMVLVLAVAVAWAGYTRFGPHELTPRSYPAAQTASAQFQASPGPSGQGVFQTLTRVASVGNTVVAVGSQAGGDLTRGQFFVSTDAGGTWRLAAVRGANGGDPAPGHPAQLLAGGPGDWLAVGSHAIWTSQDAQSWTLAATAGITPTDSGDQVTSLTRTASGWLAAGQNTAEATGVIWTSRNGRLWTRVTAAQAGLPVHDEGIVSITGVAAHGPDIVLSGQISRWSQEAGPRTTVTWLSTDGGRTWRPGSVPAGNGASPGLAGLAATGQGFVAVRPGTAPSGRSQQARPAGIVYASPNGLRWHYVASLTAANGVEISTVKGGSGGFAVLGRGPAGFLYGYTSTDGSRWKAATSFGPAPEAITGTTVTASGVQIATGATGTPVAQRPYLAVAAPGHAFRVIDFGRIAGATITPTGVNAVASAGQQAGQTQVAAGESAGTLAVWSRPGRGLFTRGTWATATGEPPAVDGTQELDSVADGPAGWLATGNAMAGTTPYPVLASSPDGRNWRPDRVAGLTRSGLATAQAAANGSGYVIVGSATTGAGTFPVAWSSRDLRTWTRTAGAGSGAAGTDPGQLLGVAAGTSRFVAVGSQGIDPAVWTSADGRHWTAHRLKIPGTAAQAELSRVAINGHTVVAFGQEIWASGDRAALAEVSHDDGKTWLPVKLHSPGGVATVTAVTAMSGGFTAVGTYGPGGHRDVAVWTSANGDTWRTQTPRGTGLSGSGFQQITGLTGSGSALTGVGYTATSTTEQPTLWQVPAR